jgi:hypothetical protein
MGGLGAQAETLGQEEILQGSVSRMEADMQMAVVRFASDCITDLGFLMWGDEFLAIPTAEQIGTTGEYVDTSWRPGYRRGRYEDYQFKIEPYSMKYKTPQEKLNELFATLQQIAPLWPMFQASGANLDVRELVNIISDLQNRPELKRIITFVSQQMPGVAGDHQAHQSPVTTRNVVRRNVPTGGTPEARSNILQQVLSGASAPQVSGQQAASIGRAGA